MQPSRKKDPVMGPYPVDEYGTPSRSTNPLALLRRNALLVEINTFRYVVVLAAGVVESGACSV